MISFWTYFAWACRKVALLMGKMKYKSRVIGANREEEVSLSRWMECRVCGTRVSAYISNLRLGPAD